ncbi:MAG TPA: tautomerase family protein [Edaphobacter sp.]|nr:tautomerase family protein [Edaphobacter sp.]
MDNALRSSVAICEFYSQLFGDFRTFSRAEFGISVEVEKRNNMPHVIVKLWPGKSEEQRNRLAEEITKDVMEVLNYGAESVSVALQEVEPQDWEEKVYRPDILAQAGNLYKKPGYTM